MSLSANCRNIRQICFPMRNKSVCFFLALIKNASVKVTIFPSIPSFCFDFDPDTDPDYWNKPSKVLKEV